MVRNVLLSDNDNIWPHNMRAIKDERAVTVIGTLRKLKTKCSVLAVRLKINLRRVCDRHDSVALVLNEHEVRVKNIEKNVDEKELKKALV